MSWDIGASAPVFVFLAVALITSLVFSVLIVVRLGGGGRRIAAEIVRSMALGLLAFGILKPELVRQVRRLDDPEVVVLSDASGSMATRDVPAADSASGQATRTRREAADALVAGEFHAPLTAKFRVSLETFPEPLGDANSANSTDGTDLNRALTSALASHPDLRAVVLLSDGDWTSGESPVTAASNYRKRGIPVYAAGIGVDRHLPDVRLKDVRVPAFSIAGEHVSIPFAVDNHLRRDLDLNVQLRHGDAIVAEKRLSVPALAANRHGNLLWRPPSAGEYALKLVVPVQEGERIPDNNRVGFALPVRDEILDVLIVDSRPRWEYRYTRNALMRDPGVAAHCMLFHPHIGMGHGNNYLQTFPQSSESLSRYDVVFLGDVGVGEGELTPRDAENLNKLVRHQGSGIIFLPGPRGRHLSLANSALGELYPVLLDSDKPEGVGFPRPSRLHLTSTGRGHLLTRLASTPERNAYVWRNTLPGFHWNAAVQRAVAGADVLAVHSEYGNRYGRLPLLVTKSFGNGQALFMGTAATWRWRRGVEDLYHYRFWGQVIRWMAHKRHMAGDERGRLFFSPENPAEGARVRLTATLLDGAGYPLRNAEPEATVSLLGGSKEVAQTFPLGAEESAWGVYAGTFLAERAGKAAVEVVVPGAGQETHAVLEVRPRRVEPVGRPANLAALGDIARVSGGRFAPVDEAASLIRDLAAAPRHITIMRRIRVWAEGWFLATLVALLSLYWILRKSLGLT